MAGPPSGFGGQPGYPPGSRPPQGGPIAQQFQRHNPAAEVEGASKSKSQLIVGIDFVSATMRGLSKQGDSDLVLCRSYLAGLCALQMHRDDFVQGMWC